MHLHMKSKLPSPQRPVFGWVTTQTEAGSSKRGGPL